MNSKKLCLRHCYSVTMPKISQKYAKIAFTGVTLISLQSLSLIIIILVAAPFILSAQQGRQDNRVGPTSYRLTDITGRAIVTQGRADSKQWENGNIPAPSPTDDGMDTVPFQEEDAPSSIEIEANPLPPDQGWELDNDSNLALEVGAVRDLVIERDGLVSGFVADLSENRGWDWWSGRGLYIIPAVAFTAQESEGELIFELNQVPDATIPRAESEAAVRQLLAVDAAAATSLKDFSVVGVNNEHLGYIEDLVIDIARNQVVYAALATGGFLGAGTRFYAIPFYEMQFNTVQEQIQLDLTLDQLQSRGSFDPGHWPGAAAP